MSRSAFSFLQKDWMSEHWLYSPQVVYSVTEIASEKLERLAQGEALSRV
jgi:hypothetical protein